ncbi:MAG: hypothetical protein JNK89_04060 [Saprospiraceae bacterium]|nr:hypothetical protein [Saprospiraceae bacterium]
MDYTQLKEFVSSLGIANLIALAALIVTLAFALRQVVEMKKATYATAFNIALDNLQSDDKREARKIVLTQLKHKKFSDWTDAEKLAAEKVGQSYDVVGIMVRNKMLPVRIIADSWGDSLRRTWKIIAPMVDRYREERGSSEFWDDYEWLAKKAERYKKPYKRKRLKNETALEPQPMAVETQVKVEKKRKPKTKHKT